MTSLESEWFQIILHEIAKAGVGELARFAWGKLRQLFEKADLQDPDERWVPIGCRVFSVPDFAVIYEDVDEVPPLAEQAAVEASSAESTRLNRGYFESYETGKFHEYLVVGLPGIPNVDPSRITDEFYSVPDELLDISEQRAAVLYYSRVVDRGQPFEAAMREARTLLR